MAKILRLTVLALSIGLVGTVQTAQAVPYHHLNVGDLVTISALGGGLGGFPAGFRVVENGPPSDGADVLADFLTFCIDAGFAIPTGTFRVVAFTKDVQTTTAQLYTRFLDGTIPPGYPGPAGPIQTGLQAAVYYLEGGQFSPGALKNAYSDCVEVPVSTPTIIENCDSKWADIGSIRRLVLEGTGQEEGEEAQPLLVSISPDNPDCRGNPDCEIPNVPEPGSLLLLGSGLVGLATAARRRMRRR